jgi:hypothetical protein
MSTPDPVPKWFNVRYIFWMVWSNAITILGGIQAALAALLAATMDSAHPPISHEATLWITALNAGLIVILANINRKPQEKT